MKYLQTRREEALRKLNAISTMATQFNYYKSKYANNCLVIVEQLY